MLLLYKTRAYVDDLYLFVFHMTRCLQILYQILSNRQVRHYFRLSERSMEMKMSMSEIIKFMREIDRSQKKKCKTGIFK